MAPQRHLTEQNQHDEEAELVVFFSHLRDSMFNPKSKGEEGMRGDGSALAELVDSLSAVWPKLDCQDRQ